MGLFDKHGPTVSLDELRARMQRGDKFVLVEALADHAYRKGHLPGAVNLPRSKVDALAPSLLPDKGAEIIVYCKART